MLDVFEEAVKTGMLFTLISLKSLSVCLFVYLISFYLFLCFSALESFSRKKLPQCPGSGQVNVGVWDSVGLNGDVSSVYPLFPLCVF